MSSLIPGYWEPRQSPSSVPEKKKRKPPVRRKPELGEITPNVMFKSLGHYFEWQRHVIIPNIYLPWEMDVAILTAAGYLVEVELKVSASDWKADLEKEKWKDGGNKVRNRVRRFYYCVPHTLLPSRPEVLPEGVGILFVDETHRIRTFQEAQVFPAKKVSKDVYDKMLKGAYYRYWRMAVKDFPFPAVDEPTLEGLLS